MLGMAAAGDEDNGGLVRVVARLQGETGQVDWGQHWDVILVKSRTKE